MEKISEEEILLREYEEAGRSCRNHDQLIRTGLTIFTALQAAILGFVGTRTDVPSLGVISLEVLGFWLSAIVLLTTLRLHYRYKTYMDRARCIERKLGMYLYQYSFDYFGEKNLPGQALGNKRLWASLPFVALWLYAFLLVRDGNKYVASLLRMYNTL